MAAIALLIAAFATAATAKAQERPLMAVLLDRLCAKNLRANEEDRLYGTISISVRTTVKYSGGVYSPDLVDDAVQNSVVALLQNCPRIVAIDDAHRLGLAIEIVRDETTKLIRDGNKSYSGTEMDKATAADLSEELSSREIDAWLDGLNPQQRALAIFLYNSEVSPDQVAAAVGVPPGAISREIGETKTNLLRFFREDADAQAERPRAGPPIEYRFRSQGERRRREADAAPRDRSSPSSRYRSQGDTEAAERAEARWPAAYQPLNGPALDPPPEASGPALPLVALLVPGRPESIRITGISSDIYGGWSLLAAVKGLTPGQRVDVSEPFLLLPGQQGHKRMLVVGLQEISSPAGDIRRFLLKAFSIDADSSAAGLGDTFQLGEAHLGNPDALLTLQNRNLSYIEKTRCLWRDYGTAPDPGLCR
ncbi:MAG: sigma-70 family RNA polymerase sigma factor [Alphaproteobacteria bacterium]|nr:sigma-70 family RNA polymerase sigma factor [Alphaproteobacteria bacterium]